MSLKRLSLAELLETVKRDRPDLVTDSRKVRPGTIFPALPPSVPGAEDNSRAYSLAALKQGARGVVSACAPAPDWHFDAAWVQVDDVREALGILAAARYDTGRLPFPLIGFTGTNGKTTSVYLLEHLYRCQGKRTGVMGTVSYRWPGHDEEAPLTTPDCLTLHRSLAAMRDSGAEPGFPGSGVDAAIMEVSSHAIDQKRIAGLAFSAALFTNLTQDHLDYHNSMETYYEVKKSFLKDAPRVDKVVVVNADDLYGRRVLREIPHAVGFSLTTPAGRDNVYLNCRVLEDGPEGLRLHVSTNRTEWDMLSPLVGRHNASNLAGVMALALHMGFTPEAFTCFHDFYGVSGRLERVPLPEGVLPGAGLFVDYAHTPDALVRAQEALRDAGFRRLITVFGCGGDRDRAKRPLMGEAVARASDIAVVTSDNPRTENPEAIIDDIMPGLKDAPEVHRECDRRAALALALKLMGPGDALLVAGKGHEPYQIIGTTKHHFSDQETLKELLACE